MWSDIFVCPDVRGEIIFWDVAVDEEDGNIRGELTVSHCSVLLTKKKVERAWESSYDKYINETGKQAKQVPVMINYFCGEKEV